MRIDAYEITLHDSRGRTIAVSISKDGQLYRMNSEPLDAGIYFLSVSSNKEKIVSQFIKQ